MASPSYSLSSWLGTVGQDEWRGEAFARLRVVGSFIAHSVDACWLWLVTARDCGRCRRTVLSSCNCLCSFAVSSASNEMIFPAIRIERSGWLTRRVLPQRSPASARYSKTREGVSRSHGTQVDATNRERRPSTRLFWLQYPWFCSRIDFV